MNKKKSNILSIVQNKPIHKPDQNETSESSFNLAMYDINKAIKTLPNGAPKARLKKAWNHENNLSLRDLFQSMLDDS